MNVPVLAIGVGVAAYELSKGAGGIGGLVAAAIDPDAIRPGETGTDWLARVGGKYNGQDVTTVPPKTVEAFYAWFKAVNEEVNTRRTPIDGPGIPTICASTETITPAINSPQFNFVGKRDTGVGNGWLTRMNERFHTRGMHFYTTTAKYERDWGVFGTGITLGAILAVAGAAVGSIFGPGGTAIGGAAGGALGKIV